MVCKFYNILGHEVRFCWKVIRFLKENNISTAQTISFGPTPSVNTSTAHTVPTHPWLFDTGASHHTTSSTTPLQSFSDYGGPDEIRLVMVSVFL